ncbi:Crp/Fnr family transcriptional regulator [Calditrichota bacterium]
MRTSLYLENNEQLIEILRHVAVFKPFKDENLKKLLQLSKICTFMPKEIIIREGKREKCMYLLISGTITVSKDNKSIAKLKRTGDIFGEMSLFGDKPRSVTVTAETETSCMMVDAEYLENIDEEGKNSFHAIVYQMFAQILAQRLLVLTEKYTNSKAEIDRLKKEYTLGN